VGKVGVAVKRGFWIARHARRLRDSRRLLGLHGLQDGSRLTGSTRWCRRVLHRRFLVRDLCCWYCLCIQRRFGSPFTLHGRCIGVLGLGGLARFPALLLWIGCTLLSCLWLGAWLLARLPRCCQASWRGRCSCRGGSASSNSNTTCRCADGRRWSALLRRVRGRA
jgi:hypothetical protein